MLKTVQDLIDHMDNGNTVSRAQLARVLGTDALVELDSNWKNELDSRKHRPTYLSRYADLLSQAKRMYYRADTLSCRGSSKAKLMFWHADSLFERAYEHLGEIVQKHSDANMWLDRPYDPARTFVELLPEDLPTPIWFRCVDASRRNLFRYSKREIIYFYLLRVQERLKEPDLTQVVFPSSAARRKAKKFVFEGLT